MALQQPLVRLHVTEVLDPMSMVRPREPGERTIDSGERHRRRLAARGDVHPDLQPGLVRPPHDVIELLLAPFDVEQRIAARIHAGTVHEELDPGDPEPLVLDPRPQDHLADLIDPADPRHVEPEADPSRQLATPAEVLVGADAVRCEGDLRDRGDAASREHGTPEIADRCGGCLRAVPGEREPVPHLRRPAAREIDRGTSRRARAGEEAGDLERLRIHRAHMDPREDDDRVIGCGCVEVPPEERSLFLDPLLQVEIGAADDPLATRLLTRALADRAADVAKVPMGRTEAPDGIGKVRRGQLEVTMGVDETREHDTTIQVDDLGARREGGSDLGCAADRHDPAILDEHPARFTEHGIHRDDPAVQERDRVVRVHGSSIVRGSFQAEQRRLRAGWGSWSRTSTSRRLSLRRLPLVQ
jgi:hypothetical protein